VPHSPVEQAVEPLEHVTQAFPQSAEAAQLVPNWQHDKHAGFAHWPLSEHHARPDAQTSLHCGKL
jgi:hypothetical protein